MERAPHNGDQVFEVSIYNKDVRSLVKDNQATRSLMTRWADEKVQDVVAETADHARKVVKERFPPDEGFVIASGYAVSRRLSNFGGNAGVKSQPPVQHPVNLCGVSCRSTSGAMRRRKRSAWDTRAG